MKNKDTGEKKYWKRRRNKSGKNKEDGEEK